MKLASDVVLAGFLLGGLFLLTTCTVLVSQANNAHEQAMWQKCADRGGNWVSGWNGKWCDLGTE